MDKVNLVLSMFGHELAAVNSKEFNAPKSWGKQEFFIKIF
jgi:hypothetical protein